MKDKPDIIELRPKAAIKILEQLLTMAKNGELKNLILAGRTSEGDIVTSMIDADTIEEQTLISYLQSRHTVRMIMQQLEDK